MSNARFGIRTRTGQASDILQNIAAIEDLDAFAFLVAAGITDTNIKGAITQFVVDLKGYGLWTKMKAIYPFVGGTATTHKYNLKDPRDLDAAFRLVFNGGWTHSSNGALPNGTNGYADTKLVPSNSLTFNSTHLSIYSRTNQKKDAWNGASNSFLPIMAILLRGTNDITFFDGYDFTTHRRSVSNNDSTGHFIGNISSSTSQKIYKNGSVIDTNTTAQTQTTLPSHSIFLAGRNDSGSTTTFDNKEIAFASIGDGFTDTDASNLYTSIQTLQTTLGRQV